MQRDPFLDNAKLILMVLVVVGHAIEPLIGSSRGAEAAYLWLYAFHMPLFAALAGAFARSTLEPGRIRALLWRFGAPYLVFQAGLLAVDMLDGTSTQNPLVTPYWPLWFIASLLAWSLVLPHVARRRGALPFAVVVAIGAGYVGPIGSGFTASRTLALFPFFLAGHLLGPSRVRALSTWMSRPAAIGLLAGLGICAFVLAPTVDHHLLHGADSYAALGTPVAGGVVRLALMGLACVVSAAFLRVVPVRRVRATDLARRTLYAYLLHGMVFRVAFVVGIYDVGTPNVLAVAAALAAVPLALVLMSEPVARLARPFVEPTSMLGRRAYEPPAVSSSA